MSHTFVWVPKKRIGCSKAKSEVQSFIWTSGNKSEQILKVAFDLQAEAQVSDCLDCSDIPNESSALLGSVIQWNLVSQRSKFLLRVLRGDVVVRSQHIVWIKMVLELRERLLHARRIHAWYKRLRRGACDFISKTVQLHDLLWRVKLLHTGPKRLLPRLVRV